MDPSTFPNVARLFARSLRELKALRRQATSRARFFAGSILVGDVLDEFEDACAEHDWLLSIPVDDEYWERAASLTGAANYSQMYADLTELGSCIVRASRWLQERTVSLSADDLTAPPRYEQCDDERKTRNAAQLGEAIFSNDVRLTGTGPIRVIVGLADKCNYRCRTCYQSESQEFAQFDLSSSDLRRLSDVFRYAHIVSVGGFGEPLLSPAAPHVLRLAHEAGAATQIVTNGSLLQRIANLPLDRIEVSMDGASANVLETIRSGASLNLIVKNLQALSEEQRRGVAFNVVVNKLNVSEIVAIVELARNLGLGEVCLQSFAAYLPWHNDMRLTADDLLVLDEQVKLAREQAGPVRVRDLVVRHADRRSTAVPAQEVLESLRVMPPAKNPHAQEEIAGELRAALDTAFSDRADFLRALSAVRAPVSQHFEVRGALEDTPTQLPYCLEPFTSIVVNSDGSTNPCCILTWNMGNINDQPIEEIWNGVQYRTLRSAMITRRDMPAKCKSCRDSSRWANLPRLLSEMSALEITPPRIAAPHDWEVPPSLAELPQIRDLLEPDPNATPAWISGAV